MNFFSIHNHSVALLYVKRANFLELKLVPERLAIVFSFPLGIIVFHLRKSNKNLIICESSQTFLRRSKL